MPAREFHHCEIRPKAEFTGEFRTMKRKHNDKEYLITVGEPKSGRPGWREQNYKYDREIWTEESSVKHCLGHQGKFSPARPEVITKDLPPMRLVRKRGIRTESPPGQFV